MSVWKSSKYRCSTALGKLEHDANAHLRFLIPRGARVPDSRVTIRSLCSAGESIYNKGVPPGPYCAHALLVFACAWLWRRLMVGAVFRAVSGSLGKTTAKEILAEILAGAAPTYRTWTSERPTSVALNVLRVRPWHRFAVLGSRGRFAGIDGLAAGGGAGPHRDALCLAATHTTHIGGDLDAHAREKRKIVRQTRTKGKLVLNADDPRTASMASSSPPGAVYSDVTGWRFRESHGAAGCRRRGAAHRTSAP